MFVGTSILITGTMVSWAPLINKIKLHELNIIRHYWRKIPIWQKKHENTIFLPILGGPVKILVMIDILVAVRKHPKQLKHSIQHRYCRVVQTNQDFIPYKHSSCWICNFLSSKIWKLGHPAAVNECLSDSRKFILHFESLKSTKHRTNKQTNNLYLHLN
jgi:hypothetical protein